MRWEGVELTLGLWYLAAILRIMEEKGRWLERRLLTSSLFSTTIVGTLCSSKHFSSSSSSTLFLLPGGLYRVGMEYLGIVSISSILAESVLC